MKAFDVLSPCEKVLKPLILEASAGTGKTFCIENIVMRVILEEGISIDQILVVTFTKAAAAELKKRIREILRGAIYALKSGKELPPFLDAICQRGENLRWNSLHRLTRALVDFDRASITTIHSFCFHAIQEHGVESGSVNSRSDKFESSSLLAWEATADVFRTKILANHFTPVQQHILLKRHGFSPSELAREVIAFLKRGLPLVARETNEEIFNSFCRVDIQELSPETFLELAKAEGIFFYGASHGKSKSLKKEFTVFFEKIAFHLSRRPSIECLDELAEEAPRVFKVFSKENIKKSASQKGEMRWLDLLEKWKYPLLSWGTYSYLFVRLAALCQNRLWDEYEKKGELDFSYLLTKMERFSEKKAFRESIQKKYRLAIIDEFQDTDPIQWNIFKKIFHEGKIPLVLVGDPKQSIYSFRSADVYTYLDAVSLLGAKAQQSLSTNYRSSPQLLEALNTLFDETFVPGWLPLPALKRCLSYPFVSAGLGKDLGPVADEVALQILKVDAKREEKPFKIEEVEKQFLFPYFVREIQRLAQEKKFPYSKIAFLVRDHAQSHRLATYLRNFHFPVSQQRSSSWNESPLLIDLIYLLRAILSPRNLNLLSIALGTKFFGFEYQSLGKAMPQELMLKALTEFNECREMWKRRGIGGCLEALLEMRLLWGGSSVEEHLICAPEGLEERLILSQIASWLIEKEETLRLSSEALLSELEAVAFSEETDPEGFKLDPLQEANALSILTLHMSKGLEFDVVFALGVMNRSPYEDPIIPFRNEGKLSLCPIQKEDSAYKAHLEEMDSEKARQLYVALTRAKYKLYIPVVEGLPPPKLGQASSIELLLARMGLPLCGWEEVYQRLASESGFALESVAKRTPHIGIEHLKERGIPPCLQEKCSLPELILPPAVKLSYARRSSLSFTSLIHGSVSDDAVSGEAPTDFEAKELSCHMLPAGRETGQLLHLLLEKLPLELIKRSQNGNDLLSYVEAFTRSTPVDRWKEIIAQIIFKAFKTELRELPFTLSELGKGTFFREMPFLYPSELAAHIPGCPLAGGEIKGVIDLAFSFQEKYYLLDWKSHWLGIDGSFYENSLLQKTVTRYRYDIQAELYKIAFQTYLKAIGAKGKFGGIYFLFLRGFDKNRGLYFISGEGL